MRVVKGIIGEAINGMRVDRAVSLVADVSRSCATRLINCGAVSINSVTVTSKAQRVSLDEEFSVYIEEDRETSIPEADNTVEFATVYADDDVIVVDKPAGLVVHPGAGHPNSTLVNGLLAHYPQISKVGDVARPGIVHRLDRDTSGLLMVALNQSAYNSLTAQLRAHTPTRRYLALAWGHFETTDGVIEAPIGRSNRDRKKMVVTSRGKHAITHYKVKERFTRPEPLSLISCMLKTGRTHQIRVHLNAIHHPLVGDRVYCYRANSMFGLRRVFLHAESLSFAHPVSGYTVTLTSELPNDLAAVLVSTMP